MKCNYRRLGVQLNSKAFEWYEGGPGFNPSITTTVDYCFKHVCSVPLPMKVSLRKTMYYFPNLLDLCPLALASDCVLSSSSWEQKGFCPCIQLE